VLEFRRIGILAHPLRPDTAPLARHVAESLSIHGMETWVRTAWDATRAHPLVRGSDLVIAIGGDGAMLRAARVCAPENVPVLGINAGRLGFLTETSPESWEHSLAALLGGEYWIEQRMMIHCEARRKDAVLGTSDALNDVVISRGAIAKSVQLETYIDGGWTTTYHCDGLIIATPTGSTAYALAVGGPILPPELKNILVVPVAPHLSMDRPMVIRASDSVSRFVRLRDRNYFYRSLLDRLEPRVPGRSGQGRVGEPTESSQNQ
jgi:NAD+ kinase